MKFYKYMGDNPSIDFYGNKMIKGVPVVLEPPSDALEELLFEKADGNPEIKEVDITPEKAAEIANAHKLLNEIVDESVSEDESSEPVKPAKPTPRKAPSKK